jgi:NhaP-type Na+/H+ or K+/H+ antiporter
VLAHLTPSALIIATSHHFEVAVLVLGLLMVAGALRSGYPRAALLPAPALFVLTGFVLGRGALGVVQFEPGSGFVAELAIVALIVILFRDGLEVEGEMLQTHWHLPLRKLVLAMPVTAAVVAVATHLLTGLSWTESCLLGALLSPTDPVLSSSVVTNPRVPRLIRHSLNLESGLNDGLALPAVLAFTAALKIGGGDFVWWRFVLEDLSIGFGVGLAAGLVAARLMAPGRELSAEVPGYQKSLYALGSAFATYGIAVLAHGNGLIAVFVAAITIGIRRPDLRAHFARQAVDVVELVKLGIFAVFGSLLTLHGLFQDGAAAVAIVAITLLVARPLGVFGALARTPTDLATRAFMAWFGPKGVATMTFSLLVLSEGIRAGGRIFNIAALAVVVSVIVHGLSDVPGAEWIAAHARDTSEDDVSEQTGLSGDDRQTATARP